MRKPIKIALSIILILLFTVLVLDQTGQIHLGQWLGSSRSAGNTGATTGSDAAKRSVSLTAGEAENRDMTLEIEDVRAVLTNIDSAQRQRLLDDEDAFQEFVQQEASNLSLLAAARSNALDSDPNIRFLMQRAAENILREIYLNSLLRNQFPAGYPGEDQIREYFEANRDKLQTEERVNVWQVFFPVTSDISAEAIAELEQRASGIADEIRQGKLDISTAAIRYSGHIPSSINGGYMGLLKVSELIPGLDQALLALDEGQISVPIRSESGYHIFRRGAVVPAQTARFEQVHAQIRNVLINQAQAQLKNAANRQAAAEFPVDINDRQIGEWRLRLITDLQAGETADTQD